MAKYVIGLDYGSDSARAVVVCTETGQTLATSVKYYPRWQAGKYCNPAINQYRQHPLDYIEVLEGTVKEALAKCPAGTAEQVVGIAFDTTGSTPVFTDEQGTPLALLPEFAENPNAMFVLWKDHTAVQEAAEINQLCKKWEIDYSAYEGGIYSSEWFWAKALHVLRADEAVRAKAYSIVEHCEWMPALLTGVQSAKEIVRSRCACGHKTMWHPKWNGLPSEEFLTTLDPLLAGFRDRLFSETETADKPVGKLTPEWAERLGLSTDVVVAGGAYDCHMGAVGAAVTPHTFVRIIGTSTCDVMVADYQEIGDRLIKGICGQVDGSVIPGMIGLEAGQSAYGDVYAWFKRLLEFPLKQILSKSTLLDEATKAKLIDEVSDQIIPALTAEAEQIPIEESGVLATDWINGRRTPDANQLLKGTITGLTLGTTAPRIFRALVEATAFGGKAIVDRFRAEGVAIDNVIGIGGIALKSPFVMQVLSDVLNMPVKVCNTDQACALGAAMFAATAAGVYSRVEEAIAAMNSGFAKTYEPNPEHAATYQAIYEQYVKVGQFTEKELFNR
ncbi:MAG: ribulokinase [Parabacteroides sp.]|nr:ribulokinase [Parabacteroides distasonis]MCI6875167.1 ribulokinase [Parabacteroides sp.]MDD6749804.1 ribulokinase [bacterium]MDD6765921.1 ribulokinase [bacterium]MDY3143211.1 ribulokinase [Parabacteroides sp.]